MDSPKTATPGTSIDRRQFLGGVAGALPLAFAAFAPPAAAAPRETPAAPAELPGMILRQKEPLNLEFPFPTLDGPLTPNHRFYVRNHFAVPKVDLAGWRLKIDGAVERELEFRYDDLRAMPAKTLPATIECAGNGRAFLVPRAKGLLWESGAVGNAEWTGVPLSALLEKAGVKAGAVEVVLEGADRGSVNDDPKSPGAIAFERSLPLAKAKRPEVLLAYKMNGEDLPTDHGFPLRAVVPGWYGMASVKWLTRVSVGDMPFEGYWQTLDYAVWRRDRGRPTLVPVTEMQVKAAVARPALRESVGAGTKYRAFGAAWAGESEVARVEFSGDGGDSWQAARLLGDATPFAWRLWECEWQVPKRPGRYAVMARATDKLGRTQPVKHDEDRRNYQINFVVAVEVEVR